MAKEDRIRVALDRALADVRAAAQAELDDVRQSAELSTAAVRASAARLSDGFHAIDEAPTLGAVLSALAACARLEADRAGMILVTRGNFSTYPERGDVTPEQAQLAASVVGQTKPVVDADSAAFPISAGGHVVAVLMTAIPSSPDVHTSLTLLSRHAGRVLESMTLRQITGLTPFTSGATRAPAGGAG